jgi:integrase
MALTDLEVKKSKATDKQQKLTDGGGLFLLVHPNGGKYWRLAYRFGDKQKTLSLGIYPDVSLAQARERRDDARKLLANGADPGAVKQAQKASATLSAESSFEAIAREWFAKFKTHWADSHSSKIIKRFENDIFPWLGSRPIADITPHELLKCIQRTEGRGAIDTAHRALQNCGQVFRYAVQTGRASRDITSDLRGALPPVKKEHYASITEPKAVAELLRAIDGFRGTFIVQCALKLAPLFFVRPGELRKAEWAEFDLDKSEWNIPAERMKMRQPHFVPLSSQAVKILRELYALTGDGTYLFPGARTNGRPMSDAAVNAALRRMGYDTKTEITGHGFRAMARTILHEGLGIPPEVIEHQLAHRVPDALGTAYNRTKFLPDRRKMMQSWADYLDKLKQGAEVIPFRA